MPTLGSERTVGELRRLIAYLNAIDVGELEGIRGKLGQAREVCNELDLADLAELLAEAERALFGADLKTYRKRVATVVSRLGHLKS